MFKIACEFASISLFVTVLFVVLCMSVIPLKFTDPEIERRTYVDAMTATIIDLTDGDFSDDKAVAILWRYGYEKSAIAKYSTEANQKASTWVAKSITSAQLSLT